VKQTCEGVQVARQKIKVLEERQSSHIGRNTYDQDPPAGWIPGVLNKNAGDVIHKNGDHQYQDVHRNEEHVKTAASGQQQGPAKPVRHSEEKRSHQRKKEQKCQ
jgi:hypothetical protein